MVLVSGPSKSGKTTLIERLLPPLRREGIRVGTVKHAHHGFEMDHPGKDSWRHAKAGADAVAVVSPTRAAWLVQTAGELSAEAAIERMSAEVDLVLVEGFKRREGPKILLRAPITMTAGRSGSRLKARGSRRCRASSLEPPASSSAIVLEALKFSADARLGIGAVSCRVGVLPEQLTTDELEQVVQFCIRHARPSRAATSDKLCQLR